MQRFRSVLLVGAALSLAGISMTPAQAGDGNGFAAGIVGGLAAGTLLGIAASGPHYGPPPPVYVAPEPVYGPTCYWTRGGQPYWDGYAGAWIYPRVRVCE
jgi:hypothetical protein